MHSSTSPTGPHKEIAPHGQPTARLLLSWPWLRVPLTYSADNFSEFQKGYSGLPKPPGWFLHGPRRATLEPALTSRRGSGLTTLARAPTTTVRADRRAFECPARPEDFGKPGDVTANYTRSRGALMRIWTRGTGPDEALLLLRLDSSDAQSQ